MTGDDYGPSKQARLDAYLEERDDGSLQLVLDVGDLAPADGWDMLPLARVGDHDLPLPGQSTPGAAGYELRSAYPEALVLEPGTRTLIPTGFSWQLPEGCYGQIAGRSGLATHGLEAFAGVIDSDYRGEVKVLLRNFSTERHVVHYGDRIAQLLLLPCDTSLSTPAPAGALTASARGGAGFGSTGTN